MPDEEVYVIGLLADTFNKNYFIFPSCLLYKNEQFELRIKKRGKPILKIVLSGRITEPGKPGLKNIF